MAEDNRRPASRGAGRGYSGYDRHGNYDPYGDLLRFREAEEPQARDGNPWPDSPDGQGLGFHDGYHGYGGYHGHYGYYDDGDDGGDAARLASRRRATERATAGNGRHDSGSADTATRGRTPQDTPFIPQAPAWTAPAALVLGPLSGVLLGRALGAPSGPAFTAAAVLAAMLAAASVPRRALRWAVPAVPAAVWLAGVAADLALDTAGTPGANGRLVALTHATAHAAPVTAAALAAALLVVAAGHGAVRGDRVPRRSRRDASHA